MISKFNNLFQNYKYLFKTNFYIKKTQYLSLFFLSILSLTAAFSVIYTSIPFLDVLLEENSENFQEITKFLSFQFEKLNLNPSFGSFAILFLISILFKSITDVVYEYHCIKLQYIFMEEEGSNLNKKIFNMDQMFFLKFSSSKILNLFTSELERSATVFSSLLMSINAFLQLLIYLAIPLYLSTKLTLFFFLILIILLIPLIFINYFSIKLGFKATKIADNLFKSLGNNLLYSKFISIHGLFLKANNLFKQSFRPFALNKQQMRILSGITRSYLQPVGILSIIIPISFLFTRVESIPILGATIWSLTRTLGPITVLLGCLNRINSEISAFKNLYDSKYSFNEFQMTSGQTIINEIKEISLLKTCFSYEKKIIFNNLNFKIFKGEKIGIVGDTGIGKSTLLDIITNVIRVNSGSRLVNNIKYEDIDFYNLRKKISYVPQSLPVLDATIKEYFHFYNDNIDDEKINYYLNLMNCNDFLGDQFEKIDTYLGDKGMKISGGQKQKVILAAALSRNPEILILDESTNALDRAEEKNIIENLISSGKDKIIIFISHKLSNTGLFDKIYKVEKNNITLLSKK